eukprot:2139930-Ditylum_brightwellii.AAC.1
MTVTRGKIHDYLGMTIDFSTADKVKISMCDYVENMLLELPPEFSGEAATPAAHHLFTVNDNAEKLNESQAQTAHHIIAQLIFLCKRARPDIQTS